MKECENCRQFTKPKLIGYLQQSLKLYSPIKEFYRCPKCNAKYVESNTSKMIACGVFIMTIIIDLDFAKYIFSISNINLLIKWIIIVFTFTASIVVTEVLHWLYIRIIKVKENS